MKNQIAATPRTLNPDGIIHNGEVGVVESPGPSQAYIPSNAISGNQFRLLNTSNHDVTLSVESGAFEIELVDADPQESIIIPPGSMFYGVTGWSTVHNTFQLFATVTSAVDGGSGPVGDWLPKVDPAFTGTLSGPIIEMGEQSPTWGAEPTAEGYVLIDPAAAGVVLETDGDANLYSRYGRWQTQGDLFVTTEGGPLTLRSFSDHAQLLGGQRVGVSSGNNRLSFTPNDMAIYGNMLKMGYYSYGSGTFVHYLQMDDTGVIASHAPNILTPEASVTNVGDNQLVTKAQVVAMGSGAVGDWLPKEDPAYTGELTGDTAHLTQMQVDGELIVGDDDSQQTYIRDNRIVMTGEMGSRQLTVSPYTLQAGGMYSFSIQSNISVIESTIVDLRAMTTEDSEASFRLTSDRQMDFQAKKLTMTALDGVVDIEGWQGVSIKGGDLSNAPSITLTPDEIRFSQNPILSGALATAELDEMALIAKSQVFDVLNGLAASLNLQAQPRVVNLEPYGSVADAQLVTKAQVADMIAAALAAHGIT